MKLKTAELIGPALDWAVSLSMGVDERDLVEVDNLYGVKWCGPEYSRDWAQGGPIIEREKIGLDYYPDGGHVDGGEWGAAMCEGTIESFGRTALVAAMRCYVASKLGDEVEIPEELA